MATPSIPFRGEVGSFDFHGDPVAVITDERGNWAVLGQLCQNLTLDPESQRKAVLRKSWSQGKTAVMEVMLPGQNRAYPQFLLHERIVPMWLANITTSRITDDAKREKVETAQVELADALYEYVTGRAQAAVAARSVAGELELARKYIAALEQNRALMVSNADLAERIAELAPKADGYDDLIAAEGLFDMNTTAKILAPVTGKLGRTRFLNLLRGMRIIIQDSTLPDQNLIDRGYFAVRTDVVNGKARPSTVVTAKGLRWLESELRDERPTLAGTADRSVVELPRQLGRGDAS